MIEIRKICYYKAKMKLDSYSTLYRKISSKWAGCQSVKGYIRCSLQAYIGLAKKIYYSLWKIQTNILANQTA